MLRWASLLRRGGYGARQGAHLATRASREGIPLESPLARGKEENLVEALREHLQALDRAARTLSSSAEDLDDRRSGGIMGAFASVAGHSLRVGPSTVPGAGLGLFLASGSIHKGAIVTCYPGMAYDASRLDARSEDVGDEAFAPLPPRFTFRNGYLLSGAAAGRDLIVDGCPTGLSVRNFRLAADDARAGGLGVNGEWWKDGEDAAGMMASTGGKAQMCRSSAGEDVGSSGDEFGGGCAANGALDPEDVGRYDHSVLAPKEAGQLGFAASASDQSSVAEKWAQKAAGRRKIGGSRIAGEGLVDFGALAARQAAMGHRINHPPAGTEPNVDFDIVALPDGFLGELMRFVPTLNDAVTCGEGAPRHAVAITSLRDLRADGSGGPVELFMCYGRDPLEVGYRG